VLTPKKDRQDKFIAAYACNGNISRSCQAAGVSREVYYNWREQDADFLERLAAAKEESIENLEAIARARAEESSDTLMIFLLKGLKPEMYRDTHRHEHANADAAPFKVYCEFNPEQHI
jgi:hypothetical protein